jgi:hypothetical protein
MSFFSDLREALREYARKEKTGIIPPFLITPTTTAVQLFSPVTSMEVPVFYVGIEIRDMGTATYVALGTVGNIESRLVQKNSYQEFEAPKGKFLDANTIMIQSDTADAVCEVSGVYI